MVHPVQPVATSVALKIFVQEEFLFHSLKVFWTLCKQLVSLKFSVVAFLIFLRHTSHSVVWWRLTRRVMVISDGS